VSPPSAISFTSPSRQLGQEYETSKCYGASDEHCQVGNCANASSSTRTGWFAPIGHAKSESGPKYACIVRYRYRDCPGWILR